jgi:Flp pilus assembly protein TadD
MPPFHGSAPARRVTWALLLLAGVVGCNNRVRLHADDRRPQLGAITPAQAIAQEGGVVKSDFRREIAPPQQVEAHLDLARALESQGNVEGAIAAYQKALAAAEGGRRFALRGGKVTNEAKSIAHRRLAAVYDRVGQFAQAEVHYRDALKLAPDDPKVWNDHGYSKYLQRDWAASERALRTAARLAPDDPRIQTNLGLCLAGAGKADEALVALSKVAGPAVGHANLGYILASLGKTEEARAHYQQALALQPQLGAARAALAQLDRLPANVQIAGTAAPAPGVAARPVATPVALADRPSYSATPAAAGPPPPAPTDRAVSRTSGLFRRR